MRRSLLVLLLIAVLIPQAFAGKWTVDSNPGNSADFSTLQAAHNGAADGDTLYVRGSAISYGGITLTKTLIIFGPGYFLTENPNTQANLTTATTSSITFDTGSNGSVMTGLTIPASILIAVNDVVLKRNYVALAGSNNTGITVTGSNVIITQNYIITDAARSAIASLVLWGSNSVVTNNYIESTTGQAINPQPANALASFVIQNNVIKGDVNIINADFKNNILISGTFAATNTVTINNIGDATQFGTADGNQENVTMTTVFEGTGSTDGENQLKTGSPAIGAGVSGVDIGMFGGTDPYVLSGLPHIPNIYVFDAPGSGSTSAGLPITLKVKSNN